MKASASQAEDRPGGAKLRVEVEFDVEDIGLHETRFGLQVELAGARAAGEPGGPALPRAVLAVALPPFDWPASIEAEERSVSRLTDGPTLVVPMQAPRAGAEAPEEEKRGDAEDERNERGRECCRRERPPFRRREDAEIEPFPVPPFAPPDQALYERASEEPPPAARHVATHHVGLTPVATIELNPVRYAGDGLSSSPPPSRSKSPRWTSATSQRRSSSTRRSKSGLESAQIASCGCRRRPSPRKRRRSA